VTCDPYSPTVTARARRGPAVPGAVRTKRGPVPLRNGRRPIRGHGAAVSAFAIQLALIVPLKAPAMQVQLAANPVEPVAEPGHGLLPRALPSSRPDNALPPRRCHLDNHADGRKAFQAGPKKVRRQQPVTSSVSGISGGSPRPAAGGGVCPVTLADGGPVLTGVVRCDPVVRGPDVAPPWPQRSTRVTPSLPFVRPCTCNRGRRGQVVGSDRG
jgi:hypothetical protein